MDHFSGFRPLPLAGCLFPDVSQLCTEPGAPSYLKVFLIHDFEDGSYTVTGEWDGTVTTCHFDWSQSDEWLVWDSYTCEGEPWMFFSNGDPPAVTLEEASPAELSLAVRSGDTLLYEGVIVPVYDVPEGEFCGADLAAHEEVFF